MINRSINYINYIGQRLFVKPFKRLLTLNFANSFIFYFQNSKTDTTRKVVA